MRMPDHSHILVDARPLIDPAGGGVRRASIQILTQLLEERPEITFDFITTGTHRPERPQPFLSHPRITHLHLRWPNKLWTLASLMGVVALDRMASRMSKRKYDAVLLCNLGFTGFIDTPYALVLHDFSFRIHPPWFTWKMRLWHLAVNPDELIRRAQRLFCVSRTTMLDAERFAHAPQDRCDIIRLASSRTDGSRTAPTLSPLPSPYLLILGVGDPRKNVATAISAVQALREDPRYADVRLVAVGQLHPSRSFRTRTALNLRQDWITYLPHVSDAELQDLYAHASALLYPSWYDGFGLPLHEAAQYRTPCIASSAGSLPETAPNGTVFVSSAKPHLWTQAIHHVLEAPELHQTTLRAGSDKPDIEAIVKWVDERLAP